MSRKFDTFTEQWIESDPEYPIWQTSNPNPVSREDGVINREVSREFILDQTGRRFEPGFSEEAEKPRSPIIKG